MASASGVDAVDIAVICLYFVFVSLVGLWSMYKSRRSNAKGYFLAGRTMTWWPVGASIFASNVGTGHFIGLAGTGAASGLAVGIYEVQAIYYVLLLAWVFVPVYISAGVVTMPEYLRKRYGGQRLRIVVSVCTLFLYILMKISVDVFAGAIFIQQAFNWNMYFSCVILLLFTTAYTIAGGLRAVMYTDTLGSLVMVIGGFVLMLLALVNVGGYEELKVRYMQAIPNTTLANPNTTCGYPREDAFSMMRDPVTSDQPWPGAVIGLFFMGTWYFCADQLIVQRALAAKHVTHAKAGSVLASYFKLCMIFMIVMPGMIARILFTGVRGLMVAVMMAALMSSLTSIFNSGSTIFTMDIWRRIRPKAANKEIMIVGRVFVVFLLAISLMWVPIVQSAHSGQIFLYINSMQSYFTPPIFACFVMGMVWSRTTEKGAFWGFIVGMALGMLRMILDIIYRAPPCGVEDTRPAVVSKIHFLYFNVFVGVVSLTLTIVISLFTERLPDENVVGMTWSTRGQKPLVPRETEMKSVPTDEDAAGTKEESDNEEADKQVASFPRWKKAIFWVCGISREVVESSENAASIEENPKWRWVANINALVVIGFGIAINIWVW
ncbi:sodium/glucose cotransporter 4-like isoform X2 [Acanthaster planci]|uniref:Sodium/myo-inositol cotransporter 2 n=1 Tax=Acanthaster planci TaxID=133434 RepID=A0A8B7ZV96_ACAPL|nr:sodium/glucose cotransporter 4-like isoform X2 [Acanthaster planci]